MRSDGRIDQAASDSANSLAGRFKVEIEQMLDESVRMNRSDAVWMQHGVGKVSQIERDDLLSATVDRSSQHMPIVRVRQRREPSFKLLKSAYQRGRDGTVHKLRCTFQSDAIKIRTIPSSSVDPLGMDTGGPLGPK